MSRVVLLTLVLLMAGSGHRHTPKSTCSRTVLFSAYQDAVVAGGVPPAFGWCKIMVDSFNNISDPRGFELLLHGFTLKYGLNVAAYDKQFRTPNPQLGALQALHDKGVKIFICDYCLRQNNYTSADLISFVTPVPFSVAYMIERGERGAQVIYDPYLPPGQAFQA
jgi:intracellular sulfur oxidation DsrE/DsrF family protein